MKFGIIYFLLLLLYRESKDDVSGRDLRRVNFGCSRVYRPKSSWTRHCEITSVKVNYDTQMLVMYNESKIALHGHFVRNETKGLSGFMPKYLYPFDEYCDNDTMIQY